MKILDHLKQRRTVRRFKPDPIPQETLDVVFEAAMWAPSHANAQPWEFVVVGREARARLLELFRAKADELLADPDLPKPKRDNITILKEDFGGAPFMVAIVSRPPDDDLERMENPLSAAIAVQNMFLAAWDEGVGAVWLSFGVAPPVRGILEVEEGETVVALLAMGYPAGVPQAPLRDAYSDHTRKVP
ncbi:MAG: nitroreductase family protein [Thermoanaerobaculales bacterium]|jgi:nitroreductase|nr:nitroreductase family protein [Thermoanaerobaculales bacterium]